MLQGGKISGNLTIRGISRDETLQIQPAACARPGYDCDLVGTGVVLRERYGIDGWRLILGNRVTFCWHGRLIEGRQVIEYIHTFVAASSCFVGQWLR